MDVVYARQSNMIHKSKNVEILCDKIDRGYVSSHFTVKEVDKLDDSKRGKTVNIEDLVTPGKTIATIDFQEGNDVLNGVTEEELLRIVYARLKQQKHRGYCSEGREMAKVKVEEAILWLEKYSDTYTANNR